jgi:hypothetical protein
MHPFRSGSGFDSTLVLLAPCPALVTNSMPPSRSPSFEPVVRGQEKLSARVQVDCGALLEANFNPVSIAGPWTRSWARFSDTSTMISVGYIPCSARQVKSVRGSASGSYRWRGSGWRTVSCPMMLRKMCEAPDPVALRQSRISHVRQNIPPDSMRTFSRRRYRTPPLPMMELPAKPARPSKRSALFTATRSVLAH